MVGHDCLTPSFWSNGMQGHHYQVRRTYIMDAFTVFKQLLFTPQNRTPLPALFVQPRLSTLLIPTSVETYMRVNILQLWSCWVKDRLRSPSDCTIYPFLSWAANRWMVAHSSAQPPLLHWLNLQKKSNKMERGAKAVKEYKNKMRCMFAS